MDPKYKFAAFGLAAALFGMSLGANLSTWRAQSAPAETATAPAATPAPATAAPVEAEPLVESAPLPAQAEIAAAPDYAPAQARVARVARREAAAPAPARTARTRSRQVYYDYSEPRAGSPAPATYEYREPKQPSFWRKHRDVLTVAGGGLGGAIIGGLAGGKKGALIGAGAGAGGGALYTYKIRNRNRVDD